MLRSIFVLALLVMPVLTWGSTDGIARADALLAAGKWQEAKEAYAALSAEQPSLGEAWFGLARSSMQLEQYDGALAAFGRAVELEHRKPAALFGSARAHAKLGHADEAIASLFAMAETGASAAALVVQTAELAALSEHPRYAAALHALRPCRSPEHRQFDFWLGDWDVTSAAAPGRPPSHNRISSREGGCVVLEEYETPSGYTGISVNFYDPNRKQWHQSWMDNQGAPILHSGGLVDGSMVLIDDPAGQRRNRTTWTPNEDGTVRQHWELSTDGGKTWSTLFDGLYTRRKAGS